MINKSETASNLVPVNEETFGTLRVREYKVGQSVMQQFLDNPSGIFPNFGTILQPSQKKLGKHFFIRGYTKDGENQFDTSYLVLPPGALKRTIARLRGREPTAIIEGRIDERKTASTEQMQNWKLDIEGKDQEMLHN